MPSAVQVLASWVTAPVGPADAAAAYALLQPADVPRAGVVRGESADSAQSYYADLRSQRIQIQQTHSVFPGALARHSLSVLFRS